MRTGSRRAVFPLVGEQIDGSYESANETYRVEASGRTPKPAQADFTHSAARPRGRGGIGENRGAVVALGCVMLSVFLGALVTLEMPLASGPS